MQSGPSSPPQLFASSNGTSNALHCDSWELTETDVPTMGAIPVSESLFSVGNGFIGIRGYPEECGASQESGGGPHGNADPGTAGVTVDACDERCNSKGKKATPLSLHPYQLTPAVFHERPINIKESEIPEHSIRGSYCAGFYEQKLLNRSRSFFVGVCTKECFLVRVPDAFCVDVYIAGEHVSAATGRVVSLTRQLDIKTGELKRRMVWESRGREVTIESTRFASAVRRNIAVLRYTVSARNVNNTEIRLVSRTGLHDGPMYARHYGIEHVSTRNSIQDASTVVFVRTHNSCRHLAVATAERCCSTLGELGSGKVFDSAVTTSLCGSSVSQNGSIVTSPATINPNTFSLPASPVSTPATTTLTPKCSETDSGAETTFTSCISERATIELIKFVGYFGDDDAPQEDLCEMALTRTREAAQGGYDALQQEHRQAMARFWGVADVRLGMSNASMQGAFRYNILQINMSCGRSSAHGFPTRGLTGELIGALHQWDVDALVVPFLTHTCPEKARALLRFRIRTLNQAKDVAADLDLPRGAILPYRTIAGTDNPTPYCAAFLFVNAVTAYAMHHYVTATNDYSILRKGGAEMVLATALVWIEWGTWEKGMFHLRCVSGPDVYNGVADDNFFTNVMAQRHLQWAVQVAEYMRESSSPEKFEMMLLSCQVTEKDLVEMQRAASKMTLLFDPVHRIFPVDQSFMRKKKWSFDETSKRGHLTATFHPNVIHRHQLCRIPDVMLAIMMLPYRFTMDEVKANFAYYEPITSRDSALRFVIFSVVASHTQMPEKALAYFKKALFVDVGNIIGNTGGGLHCTTAAGSWWALAVGFAGMRVIKGVLHFDPSVPEECEGYCFNARHRGCLVQLSVTQRLATYTLLEAPASTKELVVVHAGASKLYLRRGIPDAVRLFREVRVFDFDCVIFELDSIVSDIESIHFEAWRIALERHFHSSNYPEFRMTKELYLAYLRHGKPFSGLSAIFSKYERPLPPVGDPNDGEQGFSLYGLCKSKLNAFRAQVQQHGLKFRAGALKLISSLHQCNIVIGCVTGSRNGRWLQSENPQLRTIFDFFLDGNDGEGRNLRWRPEMDYFDACAKGLDSAPSRAIIVMDGIDGFSKASIERFCMVIDVSAEPEQVHLDIPRRIASDFNDVTMEMLDEYTTKDGVVHHGDVAISRTADAVKRDRSSPKRGPVSLPDMPTNSPPLPPVTLDT